MIPQQLGPMQAHFICTLARPYAALLATVCDVAEKRRTARVTADLSAARQGGGAGYAGDVREVFWEGGGSHYVDL